MLLNNVKSSVKELMAQANREGMDMETLHTLITGELAHQSQRVTGVFNCCFSSEELNKFYNELITHWWKSADEDDTDGIIQIIEELRFSNEDSEETTIFKLKHIAKLVDNPPTGMWEVVTGWFKSKPESWYHKLQVIIGEVESAPAPIDHTMINAR